MKGLLVKLLVHLLVTLGADQVMRALTRSKVVILTYHGFVPDGELPPEENHEGRYLEAGKFRRQLAYLKAHHNVVPIESVVAHYRDGTPLPEHPLVITVDDGYASFYHLALPLLREATLPATIFLTTGFLDGKEMLWPDRVEYAVAGAATREAATVTAGAGHAGLGHDTTPSETLAHLRTLAKRLDNGARLQMVEGLEQLAGIGLGPGLGCPQHLVPLEWGQVAEALGSGLVSVGSHTVSHPVLINCSPELIRQEIQESKRTIEEHLGQPCEVFCYPNGDRGDFDSTTRQLVREAGYACALTSVVGLNDGRTDVFELKRYMVDNRGGWADFVARTSGLLDYLLRIKALIPGLRPRRREPLTLANARNKSPAGLGKTSTVCIRVVTSPEEFASLRDTWNSLLERSKDRNPYLTWEWLYTWWRHFGNGKSLNILLFEVGGEPVGIVPLMSRRQRIGPFTMEFLENLGRGTSDYGGAILAEREAECVAAFVSYVAGVAKREGVVCQMTQIPADSHFSTMLAQELPRRHDLEVTLLGGSPCPYLKVGGSWDEYSRTLGKYLRRGIRRGMRDLGKEHHVSYQKNGAIGDLEQVYTALRRLYDARWSTEKAEEREFFEDVSRLLVESGWGMFSSITVDDTPVSVNFSIAYGGRLHDLRRAFDLEYGRYGVGQIHISFLAQEVFATGLHEYDFGRGDQEYKFAWATHVRQNLRLTAYAKGTIHRVRFRIFCQLDRAAKVAKRGVRGNIRLLRQRAKRGGGPGSEARQRWQQSHDSGRSPEEADEHVLDGRR